MHYMGYLGLLVLIVSPAAAQDMPLSQILIDGEGWKLVAKGFQSVESLTADDTGDVYVADAKAGRLHRIGGATQTIGVFAEGRPGICGLSFGWGNFQLHASLPGRIVGFNVQGQSTQFAKAIARDTLNTRSGRFYYLAQMENATSWEVRWFTLGGGKAGRAGKIAQPCGLVMSPDESTLVVGDRFNLLAFRVEADGGLTCEEPYYGNLRRPTDPNGARLDPECRQLSVDTAGRVYAATAVGVQVYDPTGRLSGVLLPPERAPVVAVTFGGQERDQLYVGCGDKVYARKLKAKGVPPPVRPAP